MQSIAHGIQVIKIERVQTYLEQSGESFERRYFTASERNVSDSGIRRLHYLAGRFAAKQAILNILDTKWNQNISWLDIEIRRLPTGEPSVVIDAQCREIKSKRDIRTWMLSISHTSFYAAANVVAFG